MHVRNCCLVDGSKCWVWAITLMAASAATAGSPASGAPEKLDNFTVGVAGLGFGVTAITGTTISLVNKVRLQGSDPMQTISVIPKWQQHPACLPILDW